jgi:hypothetical protein
VEHSSDRLIDKTRERALLQIDNAKEQARQHNLKMIALIFCPLVVAVYMRTQTVVKYCHPFSISHFCQLEGATLLEREKAVSSHASVYEPDKSIRWGVFAHIAPCSQEGELLPNHCLSIDCTCHPVRDAKGTVIHSQSLKQ